MFTLVETNLKGLGSVPLSPHMIIEAPCGGKKSALLEACSLALLGGVPDLEGRPWVQDAGTLCDSLGDENGYLWVRLHREDGATYEWSATDGKKLEKKRPEDGPEFPAPLHALDRVLSASDEKAYQHLLGLFAAGVPREDLPALLGDQWNAYRELAQPEQEDGSPAVDPMSIPDMVGPDELTAIREQVRVRISQTQAEIRGYQQAAQQPLPEQVLPSDLAQAQQRLTEREAALAALKARAGRPDLRAAQQRLAAVIQEGKKTRVEYDALQKELQTLADAKPAGTADPQAHQRYRAQIVLFDWLRGALGGKPGDKCICPTCESQVDRSALIHRLGLAVENARRRAQETAPSSAVGSSELRQKQQQAGGMKTRLDALRDEAKRLQAQIALSESDLASTVKPGELQEATAARDAAKEALGLAHRSTALWDARRLMERKAKQAEARKEADGALLGQLDKTIDTLVKRQMTTIAGKIQAHLPPDWRVALNDKPFRLGLLSPDGRRWAASGAQRNAILLAICAEAYPDALLLPPERAYDQERLERIATALAGSSAQIFLTTTEPVKHAPAGWVVYRPEGGISAVSPEEPPRKRRGRPPGKKSKTAEDPADVPTTAEAEPAVDEAVVGRLTAALGDALAASMASIFDDLAPAE